MIDLPPMPAERKRTALDLAAQLCSAEFRARLKAIGHEGHALIPAEMGSTVEDVLTRCEEPGRHLLALADESAPFGFRLAWIEVPAQTVATSTVERMTLPDGRVVTMVEIRKWLPCCDLHGLSCEPPADLCCHDCAEVAHPEHQPGVRCVLDRGMR